MISIINEVSRIRKQDPIVIDSKNSNRYRLVASEKNGRKTAYYFSIPIYNIRTDKIVDMSFYCNDESFVLNGSNAKITVSDRIHMTNHEGSCALSLPQKPCMINSKELRSGENIILPTSNGIAIMYPINGKESFSAIVELVEQFGGTQANDRCFCIMIEKFKPFAVFSAIGSVTREGEITAPAKIEYRKLSDRKYLLKFIPTSTNCSYVLFEANLYENKLFQDTTVESINPSVNNAYGSIGFIGKTEFYGEQWLYSRLDYSKLSDMIDKNINKAILHIPKFNRGKNELSAFKVASRFCSFGSNWNNKIPDCGYISDSDSLGAYQSFDITSMIADKQKKLITNSEGLILKPNTRNNGFSAVSTADSFYAPQILEICFN